MHEIKVSRADLLGDLKIKDKRQAYLDLGGQCWYVLGCNAKGKPIAEAEEVPIECGVMVSRLGSLEVVRSAPKRGVAKLPSGVWMALAKSAPVQVMDEIDGAPYQRLLVSTDGAAQLNPKDTIKPADHLPVNH